LTRVKVASGDCWDTKHGKTISMLNIMMGVVTGKTMDDAVEGKVRP